MLAQEPGRIEALVNLANLLRAQGQFDAARALLEPALARNPASPELHLTLGSAWREAGDHDARRATIYRAALAVNPNYAPPRCPIWPIFWPMKAISSPPEHCTTAPSRPIPATPRPGSTAPSCIC